MAKTRRFIATTGSALVVSSALMAGMAATGTPANAVEPTSAVTPEQLRAATIQQYGVFPLPVAASDIVKYRLNKSDLKQIAAAKKLASTAKARTIRNRESGNRYSINTGNGYYGAYQFDRGTWKVNGGARFATTADKAPQWAQDYIMFRTHRAHGWSPWAP